MAFKIKWRVQPAPTGRFRSFEHRGWPIAEFQDGGFAATLSCELGEPYDAKLVRTGAHSPIVIRVGLHGDKSDGLHTGVLKRRAATLAEAKELVRQFYDKYPQHVPK